MDIGVIMGIGAAAISVVIYIVRAEQASVSAQIASDLKSHTDGCEIRERQHDERHVDVKRSLDQLHQKLDRVLDGQR